MKTKRILALLLALTLLLGGLGTCLAAEEPWYAAGSRFVTERGLAKNIPGGYQLNSKVTRAATLQTLYVLAGSPAVGVIAPFADLAPGAWYADAMTWSWQVGILQGNGAGCDPYGTLDRAQLTTMLERWLTAQKLYTLTGSLEGFVDASEVPGWAKTAMASCASYQLVMGDEQSRLNPKGTVNWAMLGTVLLRLYDLTRGVVTTRATVVDKFGTVSTAMPIDALAALGYRPGDMMKVTFGTTTLEVPYGTQDYEVDGGKPILLPNGGGMAALCVNMGSFSRTYGLKAGDPVTLDLAARAGFPRRDLSVGYSTNRADYPSDAAFANFREVKVGNIKAGVLYRSANPVNPDPGRRSEADRLMEQAGVKAVVNLADCRFQYRSYPDFESAHYATLNIVSLNMGADFLSDAFSEDMFNGLDFLTEQAGPYLIHGDLGLNRTGFVLAVLEALMGATKEEILNDYMISYENVYQLEKESVKWEELKKGCALYCLLTMAGAEDEAALDKLDLSQAAETYLTETVGLKPAQVSLLKDHLAGDWSVLANADPEVAAYTHTND